MILVSIHVREKKSRWAPAKWGDRGTWSSVKNDYSHRIDVILRYSELQTEKCGGLASVVGLVLVFKIGFHSDTGWP